MTELSGRLTASMLAPGTPRHRPIRPDRTQIFFIQGFTGLHFLYLDGIRRALLASGAESQMLRVTVEDLGAALRLKVEGRLAGAWVPELEQSWRRLIRRSPGVSLIVDLTDTEFVDLAGTYLLSLMDRSGVQLMANSPYMKNVIAEITAQAGAKRI